jgi:hypothetical protein
VIREEIYEAGAEAVVEKNKEAISEALRFESSRSRLARVRDESRTARDTRRATWNDVVSWKKRPGRFDIRGVDTKRPFISSNRMRKLSQKVRITRRDRLNRHFRVFVNPYTMSKMYQSKKTDHFVSYKLIRRTRK